MVRIYFQQIGYDAEGEPQYGIRETHTVNRVIHTTRKQPLLKDISDLVGYTKRLVHVIPCDSVQLLDTQWEGTTRVRYRCVNIQTMEMIPLPQKEGATVRLSLAMAVVAATVQEGREQPLTVYIRQENLRGAWVDMQPDDLTWSDRVVLAATKAFKATFRIAEAHNICAIGEAEYKLSKQRLQDRGLLDSRGAITILGLNTIGATTLHELALERDPTPHHSPGK
ncbi:MAG: hypothetical protein C5B60_08935 [Chloroflexi bacterium]|nr:MAG: hypothetical protein C5B60_08935 [Chloroflexota bacterium]